MTTIGIMVIITTINMIIVTTIITMMIIIHTLKEVCRHFPSSLCNHFHLSCHKTVSWLYLSSGVLFPSVHTFCLMTTIVIMTITMVIGDVEKSLCHKTYLSCGVLFPPVHTFFPIGSAIVNLVVITNSHDGCHHHRRRCHHDNIGSKNQTRLG